LDRVAESLRATQVGAEVDIRVHGRKAWAWVDRSQLSRVVQNLAGNAVRYSANVRPEQRARVLLAVRPHAGGFAIDVIDNGLGIPADKLELVFEPYVQLHQGRGVKAGRGLGLAIVRGLALQLGLQLAPIRSHVDHGTRFRVIVPAALRRDAPGLGLAGRAQVQEPHVQWLAGRMFAVLDDEEAARDALATALRSADAHVVEAADLATLNARLDAEVRFPDALIFDLDLRSELDGAQAIVKLRHDWQVDIPAVIVTGRVAAERRLELPAGCALIAKPVSLAQLVEVLAPIASAAAKTAIVKDTAA
jgi:CheY-like chemotaxis protein/anti-sigma regulatory factor (Ser/Thr protein kinase)